MELLEGIMEGGSIVTEIIQALNVGDRTPSVAIRNLNQGHLLNSIPLFL